MCFCVVWFECITDTAEIFIAGAKYDKVLEPFEVRSQDIDLVQYGSDDTKTHRKIKHILGANQRDQVGRLLVSELYTVGSGGWSGFPSHKHDTDRLPDETRHDEVYNFRFKPDRPRRPGQPRRPGRPERPRRPGKPRRPGRPG